MCECKERVEASLLERFKTNAPDGVDHRATLNGYGWVMTTDGKVVVKPKMDFVSTASFKTKMTGKLKEKRVVSAMFFNYCPFCGVKIEA